MVETIDAESVLTENGEVNLEAVGRQISGKQLSALLEEAVNTGVNKAEIENNIPSHRFLQSRLFHDVAVPIVMGTARQGTDARNENAVQEAREACEGAGWDYDEVPFPK